MAEAPTPNEPIPSPLSSAAGSVAPSTPTAVAADASPAPVAPSRPEGIPDDLWDDKDGVKFKDIAERLTERDTLRAEAEARRAGVPEKADGYELKVPDDVKLPDSTSLNPNDPLFEATRQVAHEIGLPQSDYSKLIGAYVRSTFEARNSHVKSEIVKLGPNSSARVDAALQGLAGLFGPEFTKSLAPRLINASDIEHIERGLKAISTQGVDAFRSNGRAPAEDPNKIEGYATMSFEQKRAAGIAKQAGAAR
jgi:hypothetical protein